MSQPECTPEERLARIDERTLRLSIDMSELRHALAKNYVTKHEFAPIKATVYTVIGLMLTTVASAIIALILK